MTIETADFISQLNDRNPTALDKLKEGDDHLRLIKKVLKRTLPLWDRKLMISAEQLNKLYTYLFSIEDQEVDPEVIKRFTVLTDAEFKEDIIMTGWPENVPTNRAADSPKITGLANIPFTTAEEEDPTNITEEKRSRALNLGTADDRYLKITAEDTILGGISKLIHKAGEVVKEIAVATADGLTINGILSVDTVEGKNKVAKLDLKTGDVNLNSLKLGQDLRVSGSIYRGSDKRIKTAITDLPADVLVDNLRAVRYKKYGRVEFGFIAQEIPEELDNIVCANHELLSVDYEQLIPVLVKEIQTLKAQVQELKAK